MFRRKKHSPLHVDEFTIFGAFVAVAVFGLLYGAVAAMNGTLTFSDGLGDEYGAVLPQQTAPTSAEYQTEAGEVLMPFLAQASQVRPENFDADTAPLRQLAEKTQDRLLRVRVPAESREFHLSAVLLLDQWKRALAGSAPDRDVVVEKTKKLMDENPWLSGT